MIPIQEHNKVVDENYKLRIVVEAQERRISVMQDKLDKIKLILYPKDEYGFDVEV